jgi:hypothetical protein
MRIRIHKTAQQECVKKLPVGTVLTENLLHVMKKIDPAVGEVVLQGFLGLHQAHILYLAQKDAVLPFFA